MMSQPKSQKEVMQKVQGDTAQLVVESIVGQANSKPDPATIKKVQDAFKLDSKEDAERVL